MQHLLITGEPRVGKTSLLMAGMKTFGENKKFAGFVTNEVHGPGGRVGFTVKDLATGKDTALAHVIPLSQAQQPMVGRYYVLVETVPNVVCPIIAHAVKNGQPLVMDEVGQMQLLSGSIFTDAVLSAFDREVPTIATVQLGSEAFTDRLKKRRDVLLLQVTHHNREQMSRKIVEFIQANY